MNTLSSAMPRLNLRYFLTNNVYCKKSTFATSSLERIFNSMPDVQNKIASHFMDSKGMFEYPSLTCAIGLLGMKFKALEEKDKYYFECIDSNRRRKLVQIFDDLSDTLCKIADLSEFLRNIHPDIEMMIEAREICIEMNQIVEQLNTDKKLYKCIKKVAEKGDKFPMNDVEKHIINLFVFDFELCGIHLTEKDRQQVVNYNNNILQIGQEFINNANRSRVIALDSSPSLLKQYFDCTSDGNLIINGFSDIDDEFARECAYKIYFSKNKCQEELLDNILTYRCKLAQKCGFSTYAERALKGSTAGTPEFVFEFLNCLNYHLQDNTKNDFDLIRNVKSVSSGLELSMWDVPYFISKIKRDWLKIPLTEFSPYFSLGVCMDGLNLLFSKLFGISLIYEKVTQHEGWVPELYKIRVVHYQEKDLGLIYCDFYRREGKPNQDCHFTIKGGRRLPDGSYQNPIVAVILNFSPPTMTQPTLLTPVMLENLFHEMGHALHSMLGRAEYQHITGTRCATDFAEVPSILMEYFASDARVLKTFAKHYKTSEPIPDYLVERICDSKNICIAADLQTQIFYSILDYTYHTDESAPGNTTEILAELQEKYYPIPYVENTSWQLKFSHLVGYGAKYYSYLMSRAIASSIWHDCFINDPFDRSMGEKYRRECLAHGGGKPPRNLVNEFLSKEITPNVLSENLVKEIKMKSEKL